MATRAEYVARLAPPASIADGVRMGREHAGRLGARKLSFAEMFANDDRELVVGVTRNEVYRAYRDAHRHARRRPDVLFSR